MEEKEIKSMLFRRTFFLFLNIRDGIYTHKLSRITNITASQTTLIVEGFWKEGLLEFKKQGRKKIIFLTEKGKQVSQNLWGIKDKLGISGYWGERKW